VADASAPKIGFEGFERTTEPPRPGMPPFNRPCLFGVGCAAAGCRLHRGEDAFQAKLATLESAADISDRQLSPILCPPEPSPSSLERQPAGPVPAVADGLVRARKSGKVSPRAPNCRNDASPRSARQRRGTARRDRHISTCVPPLRNVGRTGKHKQAAILFAARSSPTR
jgi:hypothetical protein